MLEFSKLTKEEKQMYARELLNNPVFLHILNKLTNSYIEQVDKMDLVCEDRVMNLMNGYKAARRFEQDIKREANLFLDKKTNK